MNGSDVPPPPPPPAAPPPPPPPKVTARKPDSPVVSGLTCPSCGGTLEVVEGSTNLACRYCETPLLVVGERGVARFMVLAEVDRKSAEAAVKRWFGKGIRKEPRLKTEARFEEAFLAFFPFVRLRFDVVGWLLGMVERTVRRGGKTRRVEEPRELMIQKGFDRTRAAAEMAEFGVQQVNLAGDRLVALDEDALKKRGMVFRPQLAPAEVEEEVVARAMAESEQGAGLTRVTFSWLSALRRRVSVVHYPLWVFRYTFRGRLYQALVDAQDGSLAYGKAPGNHLYRAFSLVGAAAAAAFIGTTFLQHLGQVLRGEHGLTLVIILGAVLAAIVQWGYRQFRHGGIVEEGTGLDPGAGGPGLSETIRKLVDESRWPR